MQNASAEFQTGLAQHPINSGIEIHIDGCPVIFGHGNTWSAATPGSWRTIVCGDPKGLTCGGLNPDTGLPLVCGDQVIDNAGVSAVKHNIIDISSFYCTFDPANRVPNIPALELTLMDAAVLSDVDDPTGHEVTIYYNTTGRSQNKIILFWGTVKKWEEEELGLTYKVVLEHKLALLNKQLFDGPVTKLTTAFTDAVGPITIPVEDTSKFPATGNLKINDSLFRYEGKTATSFTGVYLAYLVTTNVHEIDAEVKLVLWTPWSGAALPRVALEILCSTGAGTNGAYDRFHSTHGLAYPVAYIDTNSFMSYVSPDGNNQATLFNLIYSSKQRGAETLHNLMCAMNAFLVIRNNGTLAMVPDTAVASLKTFTDSNTGSMVKKNKGDVINKVTCKCQVNLNPSWDPSPESYTDDASVAKYGEQSLEFSLVGPVAGTGRMTYIRAAIAYMVNRYKEPYKKYELDNFFGDVLMEQGDGFTVGTDVATVNYRKVDIKAFKISLQGIKTI